MQPNLLSGNDNRLWIPVVGLLVGLVVLRLAVACGTLTPC